MKNLCLAVLAALVLSVVNPLNAQTVGIYGGPDLPNDVPYGLFFMAGRSAMFNVTKQTGLARSTPSYSVQFTTNELITTRGQAFTTSLSDNRWDFQIFYTNKVSGRPGNYIFKMNAPLSGVFSNVLFMSSNAPPTVAGWQRGTFVMSEPRVDLNLDNNTDILWQRDDGHLGAWFMSDTATGITLNTNISTGIYLDSLFGATGHESADTSWKLVCQADLDSNGMQDWIWQNNESGQLRCWYMNYTNFLDPTIRDYHYDTYNTHYTVIQTNYNNPTIITNSTPTFTTNVGPQVIENVTTNHYTNPGFEITTYSGTNVSQSDLLLDIVQTNYVVVSVTNITTVTNQGVTINLTNILSRIDTIYTTNFWQDVTLTNVTYVDIGGTNTPITNALDIADLRTFTSTNFVTNLLPQLSTNVSLIYFTNVTQTSFANPPVEVIVTNTFVSPGLEVTTIAGTNVTKSSLPLDIVKTNLTVFSVTNLIALTTNGTTFFLTNVTSGINTNYVTNDLAIDITSTTTVDINGTNTPITTILQIPDLKTFTTTNIVISTEQSTTEIVTNITLDITPHITTTVITNVTAKISTNVFTGPGFEITTIVGTNITDNGMILPIVVTNYTVISVTNVSTFTNNNNVTLNLTNINSHVEVTYVTNDLHNVTVTNVTYVDVLGTITPLTNLIYIDDLLTFTSTNIVAPNVNNSNVDVTNVFAFTNVSIPYFSTNVEITLSNVYATNFTTNFITSYSTNTVAAFGAGYLVTNVFTYTNVATTYLTTNMVTNFVTIPVTNVTTSSVATVVPVPGTGYSVTNSFAFTNVTVPFYVTNSVTNTVTNVVPGEPIITYTTNYSTQNLSVLSNPFVHESMLDQYTPTDGSKLIGTADFNFGGLPDLLFRKTDGHLFWVGHNETFSDCVNNTNRQIASQKGNLGWDVVGIIDLNNDGWPDILWQNKAGSTAIWYMKGYSVGEGDFTYQRLANGNANGSLNGGAAMPWRIVGNSDLDHDGRMDLVLRHTKTGKLQFWYMNGSKIIKQRIINGPDTHWSVAGPR